MFSDYNINYAGYNGYGYQGGYDFISNLDYGEDYNYRGTNQLDTQNMYYGEIITLNKAINLIRQSVGSEKEDEMFYDILIEQAQSDKEKKIIESIRNDERKHNKILRDLYFEFTGQVIRANMQQENVDKNLSYKENLEKALFGELDAVVKYRKIMSTMPSGDPYTLVMSIMTDELRHASKYNYLIHMAG